MFKKMLPLLVVALILCAQTTLANEYYLVSTNISQGEIQVSENTTVSFTFDKPMYAFTDLESIMEFIAPLPPSEVEITGFRYTNDNKTIEFDVEHAFSTDYYWIVWDMLFEDGNSLSRNFVLFYTTANHWSPKQISGQVDAKELTYKASPDLKTLPFRSGNIKQRTTTYSSDEATFNLAKTIVFITDEILEDLDEESADLIKGAGHTSPSGHYSIKNIRPGKYYLYALLVDGDSFAVGIYDQDEDGEPDEIDMSGPVTEYEAYFSLFGFSGSNQSYYTVDETFADVREYALELQEDAKLLQITGIEDMIAPYGLGKPYNRGVSYLWTYVYYSPSTDQGFVIIATPFFIMHSPVENEIYGVAMSEIAPINLTEFNSETIAENAYQYSGAAFVDLFPSTQTQFTVLYELSTATFKYEEILGTEVFPFWEVNYQGAHMSNLASLYDEITVLVNAVNGTPIHSSTPTSVEEPGSEIPTEMVLEQNYPNPFNPTTTIQFALPQASDVKLQVFDLLGREVATLLNGALPQGHHQVVWNATNTSSGTYMYRLESGNQVQIRKMTLVK